MTHEVSDLEPVGYPFLKGHGTENDFVLLPDHDGDIHGDLSAERVRALCDRHAGIGADGVLRVIRTAAIDPAQAASADWFMDYRNADGSLAEMCGNGIRVFAAHLVAEDLVDPSDPIAIATRDGVKVIVANEDGSFTVDMGEPSFAPPTIVSIGARSWDATNVNMGNPHAVVVVQDLAEAGTLYESPVYDHAVYPDGVNIEFVQSLDSQRHIALRVFERGSGETRSCGTGACAAMVRFSDFNGTRFADESMRVVDDTYRVDVPGGTLNVTWAASNNHVFLTGPAEIVAAGIADL